MSLSKLPFLLAMLFALPGCSTSDSDSGSPDLDSDGDGTLDSKDCAPSDPTIHPGALDVCNGLDDDCDGTIDEDPDLYWYPDADGDGYGIDDKAYGPSCEPASAEQVSNKADCDDANPTVFPGAMDTCNNSDDDCDGETDEGIVTYVDIEASTGGDGLAEAPFTSINSALDNGSECIGVKPGTYVETLYLSRPVAIFSFGGSAQTSLLPSSAYKSVVTLASKGAGTLLQGFTISGGYAAYGGGVHVAGSSSTLRDLVIEGNGADYAGGGLEVESADTVLDQVQILGNSSDSGGGIYLTNGTLTATGLQIASNTGNNGGGLYVDSGGSADLADATVTSNSSTYCGGGIYSSSKSTLRFAGGEMSTNESAPSGSTGCGGALFASPGSWVDLSDLTIRENTSSSNGAALFLYGNNTTLFEVLVLRNTSSYMGGGLYATSATVTGEGLTFEGNSASYGGAVYVEGSSFFQVGFLSISGNMGYYGAAAYFADSDIDVERANISDNQADGCPGIYTYGTNIHLWNAILDANQASTTGYEPYIGAIYASGRSYLGLDNTAIVNNQGGAAIYLDSDSTFDMVDTVVAYSDGYGLYSDSTLAYSIHYSDFYGNGAGDLGGNVSTAALAADNQLVDPAFVAFSADYRASNDDLHLAAKSRLINAGDPEEDNNDPDGSRADVGAFGGPGGVW